MRPPLDGNATDSLCKREADRTMQAETDNMQSQGGQRQGRKHRDRGTAKWVNSTARSLNSET
eukprot:82106-Pyramimonas_sp.AAC.1